MSDINNTDKFEIVMTHKPKTVGTYPTYWDARRALAGFASQFHKQFKLPITMQGNAWNVIEVNPRGMKIRERF